jgi:DNA-binding NtrC family response regulator
MKVLVIEPEDDIANVIEDILKEELPNCEVIKAKTIPAVRELLKDGSVGFIIADHYYSYHSKLLDLFKDLTHTEILILSSYKGVEEHCAHIKNKHIVKKPFSLDELCGVIRRVKGEGKDQGPT